MTSFAVIFASLLGTLTAHAEISISSGMSETLAKDRYIHTKIGSTTLWAGADSVTIYFGEATVTFSGRHLVLGHTLAANVGKRVTLMRSDSKEDSDGPVSFSISP